MLFVGHAASPTGFARVIHSILEVLPDCYERHHYGINLGAVGGPVVDVGWTVHANPTDDVQSTARLREVIDAVEPQILVIVDEPWVCETHAAAIFERPKCRTVLYAAIESDFVVPPSCVAALARLDRIVAFTQFGSEVLAHRFHAAGQERLPPIEVIPHGVDTGVFFPLAGADDDGFARSRVAARERLFGPNSGLDDAFIVLNANRNQPFKRVDLTVKAFALFARDKPENVKLYLHMANRPCPPDRVPLVDQYEIRDRVMSTTRGPQHPSIASAELNLIYNACDVGLNTSEGEGWGLISFEHAATGATQIVPRHSACEELWRDAALLVEPDDRDPRARLQRFSGRTLSPERVAEALELAYTQPQERRRLARAAFENATRAEYRWHDIARRWHELFQALLDESR
ncbi:MAG: glycosyltransferase [Enhygromyxa sp.]